MARKRPVPNANKFLSLSLVIVGVALMGISLAHNLLRIRALRLNNELIATHQLSEPIPVAIPNHITIPWYVDVAIVPSVYVRGNWTISNAAASYLPNAKNTIIYGHNTRSIMGNIRALKGGEKITLTLSDGNQIFYRVKSLHQVNPSDTRYLLPTDHEILTLYTCAGLLDSQRFIVVAEPLTD